MSEDLFRIDCLKSYNERNHRGFQNLSFDLKKGEVHAIVSTQVFALDMLLDTLCGKAPYPFAGTVFCGGKQSDASTFFIDNSKFAFILQGNLLYNDFSVLDNIYFNSRFSFHYNAEEKRRECQKVLDAVELDIDLNKIVVDLSLEERKMVEFLQFFLNRQSIAVVYESVMRFSTEYMFKLLRLIDLYKKRGKSIIFLTSSVDDAMRISDRISILDQERINKTYTISEIYNSPQKMFDLLTGWTHINNVQKDNSMEAFESIIQIRNISFSSYELGSVLQTLAMDIKQITRSEHCNIYLNYDRDIIIISSDNDDHRISVKSNFIRNFVCGSSSISVFHSGDKDYFRLFDSPAQCKTLACIPIIIESKNMGMLLLGYRHTYDVKKKDEVVFMTLSREISLAIETSRLLGRSTLLQESHHRIKNNLQTIINLLYMQEAVAKKNGEADISQYVDAVVNRIKSISIVHDLITQEKTNSYIRLCDVVMKILKIYDHQNVEFIITVDDINLSYNIATSISLLINEIISNCIKHAFRKDQKKMIRVCCKDTDDNVFITIADNGRGFPDNLDFDDTENIGMTIIRSTVRELLGEIKFITDHGAKIQMSIPKEKFSIISGI